MKCKLTLKNAAGGTRGTLLAVLIAVSASACQGTIDTRHVTASDTTEEWSTVMEHIPVEMHDSLPNVSQAIALKSIPGAMATVPSTASVQGAELEATQKMVIYLGGNAVPTSASYCTPAATMKKTVDTQSGVLVAAALCDGSRLVVSSERHFKQDDVNAKGLAKVVKRMKTSLLDGLMDAELSDTTRDVDAPTW